MMIYVCTSFGIYSTFLSKVTVGDKVLNLLHLKANSKNPTKKEAKIKIESDLEDLKIQHLTEPFSLRKLLSEEEKLSEVKLKFYLHISGFLCHNQNWTNNYLGTRLTSKNNVQNK